MRCKTNPWLVTLSASLFFLFEFFQINMFNVLEGELTREFAASPSELGMLSAVYFYGTILVLFPAGILLDRFSARHLLLFPMVLTIFGTILFGMAPNIETAGLARFIVGVFSSPFCLIPAVKIASRWFKADKLALVTGLIVSIGMFGGILAQAPFMAVVSSWGWRTAVLGNALAGTGLLIWMYFFVHDAPESKVLYPKKSNDNNAWLTMFSQVKAVLSCRDNWRVGLYACFTNLPIFLLGSLFSNLFLTQIYGLTSMQAASAATLLFLGMLVGSPLYGYLSGRWGNRRYSMMSGAVLTIVLIMVLMFNTTLSYASILCIYTLLGIGTSAHTLLYPYVVERNPDHLIGSAEGFACMLLMSGGAIFQPAFGWLLTKNWSGEFLNDTPLYSHMDFKLALSIMPISIFAGIILLFFSKETFKKA